MKSPLLAALLLALTCTLAAEPGHKFPELTPQETTAINAATPEDARAKPQQPRKLLVFYRTEGFVHASIPNANYALEQMGKHTGAYTVTLSDDMAQFDPATLNTYDAVLFNNTTQLAFDNPAHRQALLDFVRNGKGLIGIHAGSDNFPKWPEGQALMGGVFHSHPWVSKDTVAVKNDDPDHTLNTAFQKRGFWVTEEIYQIVGPYSREKQRTLLSLDMSREENARPAKKIVRTDNDFPISWLKTENKGRVFYTSLGHNKNIFETPQILQHILDGIQYALGDLDADAIPSAQLDTQPTPALAPSDKTTIQDLAILNRPTATDYKLEQLARYEYGDPLAPILAVEQTLRKAKPAETVRANVELQLAALIRATDTTTAAKNIFLNWLGWIGTEKSIPTLTTAAQNPDLAHAAIRALAGLNAHPAGKALLPFITDANPEATRIEALNALGQRRSNPAVASIAKLIADKNPAIATAALEALGNIGTPDAIEALRADPIVGPQELARTRALIAATSNNLRRASTAKAAPARDYAIQIYNEILSAITNPVAITETLQAYIATAPDNIKPDLKRIESPDARIRAAIATGLATSGNKNAIKLLADRYVALPADTQARTMTSLSTAPSATALPLIDLALASTNTDVQLAAISAAAACGNNETVAKLLPLLTSENKDISAAAFTALTQLPDDSGKTKSRLSACLAKSINGPADAQTTAALLKVCAYRQDRQTFEDAVSLTKSADATSRAAAYESISLLTRAGDLPQILPLAANLKTSADRREWIKALYNSAAAHPDSAEAVALIQKQLATAKTADRATLIAALTMIKSDGAKTALNTMLASSDAATRKETIRALSSARTQTAYDLLVERITAATDASERLLAQRGAIDTVDALAIPAKDKVTAYHQLWSLVDRDEEKDAIIAALKRTKHATATDFLKEITKK